MIANHHQYRTLRAKPCLCFLLSPPCTTVSSPADSKLLFQVFGMGAGHKHSQTGLWWGCVLLQVEQNWDALQPPSLWIQTVNYHARAKQASMLAEWCDFWGLVLLSLYFISHRRQDALFCSLCFCRSRLGVLMCLPASAALWQAHSVLIDSLWELRIFDQLEILWNRWKKKQTDLAALPIAALSKINGASLRKTQQYVQQTGENLSLTYLKDEEDDEGAFCSS